jgi:hypothetical protein
VQRCFKKNTLFYPYMYVEDKHNIVTPPWWRLWAPRSTSRTWWHRLLLMGSAFSCIFKVDLHWWQSVPRIPLRRTQHRHGAVLCRNDDAKFPPETAFFTDKLTHIMRQIWMINWTLLSPEDWRCGVPSLSLRLCLCGTYQAGSFPELNLRRSFTLLTLDMFNSRCLPLPIINNKRI